MMKLAIACAFVCTGFTAFAQDACEEVACETEVTVEVTEATEVATGSDESVNDEAAQ